MVPREPRLAVRRHRKVALVLAVSIALALGGLGIESASASTRSRLAVSLNSDRSSAARLDGSMVNGKIYVFVRNSKTLDKVDFYIDSPRWTDRPPVRTDKKAPFDLAGTKTDGTARPYNTAKLADGTHSIRVVMTWANGTTSTRRGRFKVHNGGVKPTPAPTTTASPTTAPGHDGTGHDGTGHDGTGHDGTSHDGTSHDGTQPANDPTARPQRLPRLRLDRLRPAPTGTTIKEGGSASYSEAGGGEYLIHNNNWNDDAGGNTVITACNYDNWYLVSDTPNHSDMSVQTYPNVHRDYNNVPLTGITSARFAATGPRCTGCVYNIAFDIWIGSGFSHELMIWTDNWGQRPIGNIVGTVTIGGHEYQVWRSGSGDGGVFTYLSTTPQLSGDMPLSEFFKDVQNRGWKATTTWQVDYGVEIVDTNGNPERFNFTDFAITD